MFLIKARSKFAVLGCDSGTAPCVKALAMAASLNAVSRRAEVAGYASRQWEKAHGAGIGLRME